MNVEQLIDELSMMPGHLEVQIKLDNDRYTVEEVKRGQEASMHFVLLVG